MSVHFAPPSITTGTGGVPVPPPPAHGSVPAPLKPSSKKSKIVPVLLAIVLLAIIIPVGIYLHGRGQSKSTTLEKGTAAAASRAEIDITSDPAAEPTRFVSGWLTKYANALVSNDQATLAGLIGDPQLLNGLTGNAGKMRMMDFVVQSASATRSDASTVVIQVETDLTRTDPANSTATIHMNWEMTFRQAGHSYVLLAIR